MNYVGPLRCDLRRWLHFVPVEPKLRRLDRFNGTEKDGFVAAKLLGALTELEPRSGMRSAIGKRRRARCDDATGWREETAP